MQGDLFELTSNKELSFEDLVDELKRIANRIVKEMEYPEGSLAIYKNITKTETNYPIVIREFRRSVNKNDNLVGDSSYVSSSDDGSGCTYVCTPILTLVAKSVKSKNEQCLVLRINTRTFSAVQIPNAADIKEVFKWVDDDGFYNEGEDVEVRTIERDGQTIKQRKVLQRYDVKIDLRSNELLPYLESIMRNRLENYKSTEPSYGCCHLYEECSNARRCLSKDKIYATVCSYRKNLESNRIFYGKNKNI